MALLVTACREPELVDVAGASAGLRPFVDLTGVSLGMTAAMLKRQRPAARFASGSGYEELLGDRRIGYAVDGTSEHTPPRESARLNNVTAEERTNTDSAAITLWKKTLAEVESRRGMPTRCSRYDNRVIVGTEVSWVDARTELQLSAYVPRPGAALVSAPASVVIAQIRRPKRTPWWYRLFFDSDPGASVRISVACGALVRQ